MSKLHFIKAPCHQSSREQGYQFAPSEVKEKYDYVIADELFNGSSIDLVNSKIELCKGYQLLYKYILEYTGHNPDNKIITIGGDNSISSGTIAAMNEKYMKQYGTTTISDLIVLWIDSFPDLYDFDTSVNKDLNEMPAGSLLGLCDNYFTQNKLLLNPEQIIYYGLVDENDNIDMVKEFRIPYLTVKKINTLGLENSINSIKGIIGDKPVHVVLDMKVFDSSIIKSVIPQNNNGLQLEQVENLLCSIKGNVVSMDIVEFNPCIGTKENIKVTRETIRYLLSKTFDIKEKSVNIFTEDSQFLVYRPTQQEDPYSDIGWYIMRGLNLNDREGFINKIPNDEIITIEIDNEEYFVTKTTMNEQNETSYYCATTINDVVLFPEEKVCMCFELINSQNI